MPKSYVPEGTYTACEYGTSPSQIRVSNNKSVSIYNHPMATEADFFPFFNIKAMGFCLSTSGIRIGLACSPLVLKWEKPRDGVKIDGNRMLILEDSECKCVIGNGTIKLFPDRQAAVDYGIGSGKMLSEYIKEGFDWVYDQMDNLRDLRDEILPDWMDPITGAGDWFVDLQIGLTEGAINGVVGIGETVYQIGQDPVGIGESLFGMAKGGWNKAKDGIGNAFNWASDDDNWKEAGANLLDWASDDDNWKDAASNALSATKDGVSNAANWVQENPRSLGNTVGEFIPDAIAFAYSAGSSTALTGARAATREVVGEVIQEATEEAVERGTREVVGEVVEEGVEESIESAGKEAGERAGREAGQEVLEEAAERAVKEGPGPVITRNAEDAVPGSALHKQQRWQEYLDRGGEWDYDRWSKTYENNMDRARIANQAVDDYHSQLGWGQREVTVDVNGQTRRLDIADVDNLRGVEVKSGDYFSLNQELRSEILRDSQLVQNGWDITWKIDGRASEPLLEALREAGITIIN